MSTDAIETGSGMPAEPVRESLGERIPLLITNPTRAFEAIQRRPAWWLPGLILIGLMVTYMALNCHLILPASMDAADAPAAQRAAMEKQIEMFSDPPTWLRVVIGLSTGLGVWVMVLVFGLIYHLFLRLSEGKGSVGQSLGVVYWAGLVPYGLKTIVGWAILVATGSVTGAQATGLAFLVRDQGQKSVVYQLATWFGDAFAIWGTVLTIIGFAVVHRLPRRRAAIVTVAVYVLLAAVMIGISALGKAGRS